MYESKSMQCYIYVCYMYQCYICICVCGVVCGMCVRLLSVYVYSMYDVLHIVICISIVYSYMYSNNVYQCNVISM